MVALSELFLILIRLSFLSILHVHLGDLVHFDVFNLFGMIFLRFIFTQIFQVGRVRNLVGLAWLDVQLGLGGRGWIVLSISFSSGALHFTPKHIQILELLKLYCFRSL